MTQVHPEAGIRSFRSHVLWEDDLGETRRRNRAPIGHGAAVCAVVVMATTVRPNDLNGVHHAQGDWLERELDQQRLGLTDLLLNKLLQGIHDEKRVGSMRPELLNFKVSTTGGIDRAITAAQKGSSLRARNYASRKTTSGFTATSCRLQSQALRRADADFDPSNVFSACRPFTPEAGRPSCCGVISTRCRPKRAFLLARCHIWPTRLAVRRSTVPGFPCIHDRCLGYAIPAAS